MFGGRSRKERKLNSEGKVERRLEESEDERRGGQGRPRVRFGHTIKVMEEVEWVQS